MNKDMTCFSCILCLYESSIYFYLLIIYLSIIYQSSMYLSFIYLPTHHYLALNICLLVFLSL